jgi:hypothetical protein
MSKFCFNAAFIGTEDIISRKMTAGLTEFDGLTGWWKVLNDIVRRVFPFHGDVCALSFSYFARHLLGLKK